MGARYLPPTPFNFLLPPFPFRAQLPLPSLAASDSAGPTALPLLWQGRRPGARPHSGRAGGLLGLTGRGSEFPSPQGGTPASHTPPRPKSPTGTASASPANSQPPLPPQEQQPRPSGSTAPALSLGSCGGFKFKPPLRALMRSSRPAARAALAFPPTQVAPQEKRERPASGGGGGAGFASRLRRGAAPGRTLGREGGTRRDGALRRPQPGVFSWGSGGGNGSVGL